MKGERREAERESPDMWRERNKKRERQWREGKGVMEKGERHECKGRDRRKRKRKQEKGERGDRRSWTHVMTPVRAVGRDPPPFKVLPLVPSSVLPPQVPH